jgi:thioredoxin-related protein
MRKEQTTIYKALIRKLETEQHEPHLKVAWIQALLKIKQLLLQMSNPSCYYCSKLVIRYELGKGGNYIMPSVNIPS